MKFIITKIVRVNKPYHPAVGWTYELEAKAKHNDLVIQRTVTDDELMDQFEELRTCVNTTLIANIKKLVGKEFQLDNN